MYVCRMNANHEMLRLLVDHFLIYDENRKTMKPQVPIDTITDHFGWTLAELHIKTAELFTEKDVRFANSDGVYGVMVTNEGITAYANNKYKKKVTDFRISRLKDYCLLAFGLVGMLASIISTCNATNSISKTNIKLYQLELQIKSLQPEPKNENQTKNPSVVPFASPQKTDTCP